MNTEFIVIEIDKIVKQLKNNKILSIFDSILNEYVKYVNNTDFLDVVCKLFDIILDSGIFPDVWSKRIILLLFKNKGDRADPNNYRGVTILSCLANLFTSVLNERLNKSLESYNILCEEQAGFRKNYNTVDHYIFSLNL